MGRWFGRRRAEREAVIANDEAPEALRDLTAQRSDELRGAYFVDTGEPAGRHAHFGDPAVYRRLSRELHERPLRWAGLEGDGDGAA